MKHPAPILILALFCLPFAFVTAKGQGNDRLVWPAPPQQARIEYVTAISSAADIGAERSFLGKVWDWIRGADAQQSGLIQPMGVAVDGNGVMYVTDPGAGCVHVFDRRQKKYDRYTSAGDDVAMRSPIAIAVGGEGQLYITDSVLKRVLVYRDGNLIQVIEGPFDRPTGIAVKRDTIFVSDTALNKLIALDGKGTVLFTTGSRGTKKGEFNFPVFIASAASLFVVDAMNFRVQVLNDTCGVVGMFGGPGNVQGTFANPKGIAVDKDGHIYVTDALFDTFQIFTGDGKLLLVVGSTGQAAGEFRMPAGIWIDQNEFVYVVDVMNKRVQIFRYLPGGK